MIARRQLIDTDVLVVGSEGAGSRAAIEVARSGLKVIVATKGVFTRCGATVTAGMDIDLPSRDAKEVFGLPGDERDTIETFAQDMFEEGKYMNNEEVVFAHCVNAAKYLKELADWGMKIESLTQAPGHRYPRGIWSTGRSMMSALKRGARQHRIDFAEHTMITNLLTRDGRVIGAVGIDLESGDFLVFRAKAVVLATGGAMRLYPITTAPEELTGDGLYLAYQAGAELVDMEFPLFLPCCLYWPESMLGQSMYGINNEANGWWLNKFGIRFIEKWDPVRMEIGTTRDVASIAMAMEILEGRGSPHGGVFLSFKHIPGEILDIAAEASVFMHDLFYGNFALAKFDMDPKKVAFEVGPAAHYWNGGIKVNGNGETTVPGLFAAGEVQGGTMGANRLSGNAVTECVVFGALAGGSAARFALNAPPPEIDEQQVTGYQEQITTPLTKKDGADIYQARRKLQEVAFKYAGPIRDESGLKKCLAEVAKIKQEVLPNQTTRNKGKVHNREWVMALENLAMTQVLEIVASASLMRQESRGAMYRLDYPETDNRDWLKNIFVKDIDGKVNLEAKPVVTSPSITLPERTKVPYMVPTWKFDKKM